MPEKTILLYVIINEGIVGIEPTPAANIIAKLL